MKLYSTSRISRRLGERFPFKAERDAGPKSAMVRRPYPPGMHGKRRSRGLSEFGTELVEKQKVRYLYGLSDGGLKKLVDKASRIQGKTKTASLFEFLERRLDNVVWRLGLAPSRRVAQHLVSYGYIMVNGKAAKVPSRLVRPGDTIEIRESKRASPRTAGLEVHLKKHQPPAWLAINPETWTGEVKRVPNEQDELVPHNLSKVVEYFSR